MPRASSLKDRVYPFLVETESGCLVHTKLKPMSSGHVQIMTFPGRKKVLLHRLVYEWEVGPIPDGYTVDHTCHNDDTSCPGGVSCPHRACCNSAHLEAVTRAVNTQRGRRGGGSHGSRTTNAGPRAKCRRGHELDEENTLVSANGRRRCRTCKRMSERAYYQQTLSAAAREKSSS